MSIQLTVMSLDFDSSGTPITKTYHKEEITLGRFPENDVVLDKPEVSGVHAKLRVKAPSDGGAPVLLITDLGSSNGTLVENSSLSAQIEVEMQPNERIIIGNYLIKPTVFKGANEEPSSYDAAAYDDEGSLADLLEQGAPIDITSEGIFAQPQLGSLEELGRDGKPAELPQVHFDEALEEEAEVTDILAATPLETNGTSDTAENGTPAAIPPVSTAPVAATSGAGVFESVTINLDGNDVLDINFDAVELFTVGGTITHKGNPLNGVKVDGGALGTTFTGADGRYSFTDVEEGTAYSISANKDGFILDCIAAEGTVEADCSVPFTATELFKITGKVTHKGMPLAGAKVEAGELGSRVSDETGSFVFDDIPEFTHYRIHVTKDGYLFESQGAGQVGSKDEVLNVTARKLLTISGRVLHKGVPLEGVEVDGGTLGRTVTGPDGVYTFENVPEGAQYTITARKDRYRFGTRGA